jgi:hypothetical protein
MYNQLYISQFIRCVSLAAVEKPPSEYIASVAFGALTIAVLMLRRPTACGALLQ